MPTTLPPDELFELDFEDEGLEAGFTTIQNAFIVHFMPKANGNYVKVYLAGLARCFGSRTEQWASARTIADEQQISVDTVRRAWRYWEEVGLIKRIPRYVKDKRNFRDYRNEPDAEYCHQISSVIRFRRNLKPPVERTSVPMHACTPPLCTPAHPPYAAVHTIEEVQTEEVQPDKTVSGMVQSLFETEIAVTAEVEEPTTTAPDDKTIERVDEVFTDIMNRPPTKSEQAHLIRLLAKYDPDDLETAIFELMVQRDQQRVQNPTRYLEGILDNWYREGRRTTDMIAHMRKMSRLAQ